MDDKLDSLVREEDFNSENVSRRLRFLERQHEEKQQEIKSLMNDVKLRDCEIKNLQECLNYLLEEKNELQNKVKVRKIDTHCIYTYFYIVRVVRQYLLLYENVFQLIKSPTDPSRGVSEQVDGNEEKIRQQFERFSQKTRRNHRTIAGEIRGYHEDREEPVRRGRLAAGTAQTRRQLD